ncbi:MAG: hypothetical protein R3B09_22120 [Nannocystaceae bacterium]
MRIVDIDAEPLHTLEYLDAAPRGGTQLRALPIHRGRVHGLPSQLDALVITSDLQGRAQVREHGGESRLLGEALVEELADLADLEVIPPLDLCGAILAGDLYAAPGANKMGATGDVREVWRAFAAAFRWVAGVAGNHDLFGAPQEQARFGREPGIHLLDGQTVGLDDLRIAGVAGICGRPGKPNRRPPEDFEAAITALLHARPDLLVLHEGPDSGLGRGNPRVRALVEDKRALVVCGHAHWHEPLAELAGGAQVLNVDARVVVLEGA